MVWQDAIPYFSEDEVKCQGSGIIRLDPRFAAALPFLRMSWGTPLYTTSVCRSPEHNEAVGGAENSFHLTENDEYDTEGTMAADIFWEDMEPQEKLKFAQLAYDLGFSVGLHDTFCHVDLRAELGIDQIVFTYSEWKEPFAETDVME